MLSPFKVFFLCVALLATFSSTQVLATGSELDVSQTVYVNVGMLDIDAISSADQSFTINIYIQFRWQDPALAHDGDGPIRKSLTDISAPRFILVNRQKTWSSLINVVEISPEGEATYCM